MSNIQIMDTKIIKQMIIDTSEEVLPTLIEAFRVELAKHKQMMKTAYDDHDYIQLREAAHGLKSCSGTFGAQALYQQSMLLEASSIVHKEHTSELVGCFEKTIDILIDTQDCYNNFDFTTLLKLTATNSERQ